MSCLGPLYNPQPPREWYRFSNILEIETAETRMLQKGNVLQYKKNSLDLTKQQRYAQIARGLWTNRNTTWASQSETYSNPNLKSLQRVNYSGGNPEPGKSAYDSRVCPPPNPPPDNNMLPSGGGGDTNPDIPPIVPGQGGNDIPIFPVDPAIDIIIPDGGTLVCNTIENFCTGEVIRKTSRQFFHPTSDSDVPGKIIELFYDSSVQEPYYPKTKLTYGTSGDKWPVGAKFIRSANAIPAHK
jgi:hypothetical protein